ncbi:MAG: hypothetical protein J6M20_04575 [Clostridia bacterium]|nr:hypothetical protein [Clostridia bacterium]
MKNIGKIILLVLGIALIALGIKNFADLPGQSDVLEAAVYLDEAVILPENEGKMVIIHGKPEMTGPAYDEELGLSLDTIKAYRYAEEYKLTSSEKMEYKYGWVAKGQKSIVGKASLGEFALDEKTLIGLSAGSEYEDFNMEEISAKGYEVSKGKTTEGAWTDRWWVIVGGTYYYDAFEYSGNLDIPHLTREMNKEIADEREGAKAYAYKVYTGTDAGVTVAGIQQGNTLVAHEKLGAIVKDGVQTKDQLLSSNKNGVIGGAVVFMVIGAVLVVLGIRKPKAKEGISA